MIIIMLQKFICMIGNKKPWNKHMSLIKKIKNRKGVSLLELIIAIGIFSIIILSAIGIFQSVVNGQRDAISAQNIQENIRYAMETISREIRMAQKTLNNECNGSSDYIYRTENNTLYFKNMHGECVEYETENNAFKITRDDVAIGFITPNEIIVTNLKFNVVDGSATQPRVSLRMDVEASTSKKEHKQKMVIQTTISSRDY